MLSPPADVASPALRDGREPDSAEPRSRVRMSGSQLVTAAAGLAGLAWIVAAFLTAGRGFDVTDEGYYLLSYRWWDANLYTYTGVQYFYGPVFELLGYNIAGLRVFRLLTVVATHAAFAWAFMTWLRTRRPLAPVSRWWEVGGTAVIVAAGGMVYSWLPLSPGYNDVSLLGALLAASIALRIARAVERGEAVRFWVPALLGPVAVIMVLAKWASSALTLTMVGVVIVVVAWPLGRRGLLRIVAAVVCGAGLTLAAIQVFVVSLSAAVPPMLAINRTVAAGTNSPGMLLQLYFDHAVLLLQQVVMGHGLLLVAAAVAPFARRGPFRLVAYVLVAAGLAVSLFRVLHDDELRGGTIHLDRFPISVTAALAAAVVLAMGVLVRERIGASARDAATSGSSLSRRDRRGWLVLAMLAALPLTQAAGTGNPVHMLAIVGLAAWVAVVVAIATGVEAATGPARLVAAVAVAGAVLCTMFIAMDGLWHNPYRTVGYSAANVSMSAVPALSSLRLDPKSAAEYTRLHDVLRPYLDPPGRAVMAFDELPGLVLLLDGRPVGEGWYSAIDNVRTAAGIRHDCAESPPWFGNRAPILLFLRPVTPTEIGALQSCGLTFATDYRLLATLDHGEGGRVQVYVPIDAGEGR